AVCSARTRVRNRNSTQFYCAESTYAGVQLRTQERSPTGDRINHQPTGRLTHIKKNQSRNSLSWRRAFPCPKRLVLNEVIRRRRPRGQHKFRAPEIVEGLSRVAKHLQSQRGFACDGVVCFDRDAWNGGFDLDETGHRVLRA